MADLVRESVSQYLARTGSHDPVAVRERLLSLAGRYSSAITDLGERHDEHLARIYDQEEDDPITTTDAET